MSSIIEAHNALLLNEEDDKERVVSWREKKAKLWGTTMAWENGTLVRLCASTMSDWEIKEPKPEPKKMYVDCPVFKDRDKCLFQYKESIFCLYKASNFDLIGYVYANGEIRNVPTLYHGRYCAERCVAVRIAKGE